MLLTAIMFMLGVAQIGPAPVLLGGARVSYTLLVAWVRQSDEATPSKASGVESGGVRAAR